MLYTLIALAVILVAAGALVWRLRQPRSLILQWGKFVNERPGIKGHAFWTDEPDIVQFQDYRYWIRLKPNPGVNLPVLGYWSKARGRHRS